MNTLAQLKHELRALDQLEHTDLRIERARRALREAELDLSRELLPRREALRAQIAALKAAKPKALPLPAKLVLFLRRIKSGVEWTGALRVTWHSDDLRFAVISCPGGTYVSGQNRLYGKAQHWLVDLGRDVHEAEGYSLVRLTRASDDVEGRLSKAQLEALKSHAAVLAHSL